jgi:hypothetical protein
VSNARPTVLIIGGLMTAPANYWPMRRRLSRRNTERVDIAPIWPPDWVLASLLGLNVVMSRARRAIANAYHAAGKRPIIVVAHSGGGIAARLAMSPTPFNGQAGGVAAAVGCLVTLGTPHMLTGLSNRYRHAGHHAVDFLDRHTPGAYFAPRTGYLSVGSRQKVGMLSGFVGRASGEVFSMVVGSETQPLGRDSASLGDGIVPLTAVHLAGAQQITFDDVVHGHIGTPWYGDDRVIDRWWPEAVRIWRDALAAREQEVPATGPDAAGGSVATPEQALIG